MNETFDIDIIMKKARHKAEFPLFILAVLLNFFVLFLFGRFFALRTGLVDFIASWLEIDGEYMDFLADSEQLFVPLFLIILILIIIYNAKKLYHGCYVSGIRVSEKQFPEIYAIEQSVGAKMKLKPIPKVFISASSSTYSVLNIPFSSDSFVTVAPGAAIYNPDIAEFNIIRDFAHVYYGHRSMWFYLLTFFAHAIPIFGPLLHRTLEYSADRAAKLILGDEAALECLIKSSVHYLAVRKMDTADYLEKMTAPCGKEASVYYFLLNLVSNMPITRYRLKTMADANEKHCGRLF